MNCSEKVEFVRKLTGQIKDDVIEKIVSSKIPANWDGHELRQFLADKFNENVCVPMVRSRMKEYKNTVIINNL